MFVQGKPIAGGIPAAVFGLSEAMAQHVWGEVPHVPPRVKQSAHAGLGGTLADNSLTVTVMRAALSEVLTDAAFARILALSGRLQQGVNASIARHGQPWHVTRAGARVERLFARDEPRDVKRARDPDLEALQHLFLMNRGVLITPFHNMMLCCPGTTTADVDLHNQVFEALAQALTE